MEKAILKTLIYADFFDYPLKGYEIHKWLIGKKLTLRQVEKALEALRVKGKAERVKGYWVLPKRKGLVNKRKRREKQSQIYLRKAKLLVSILKIVPWIKLVGISGGLAMENANQADDIDLFIITKRNRLWLSRILAIMILDLLGVRRKAGMKKEETYGKLCLNILLEEDKLKQIRKDLFVAHEVLQMKVLWQREGVYSKYLLDNEWVFKFLPSWITSERLMISDLRLKIKNQQSSIVNHKSLLSISESLAKKFQLMVMGTPKGMERIEDGALYFHPLDYRLKVLEEYNRRLKRTKL